MNSLQNGISSFLLWTFCYWCLPVQFFACPWPRKGADILANHSCRLGRDNFQQPYIRNRTYTLAKLARFSDKDTDNRFIGQHLYFNIKENDRCYLINRVTEIVVKTVLSKLKNQYPSFHEVASFLACLNMELSGCRPVGNEERIESILEQMKYKLKQLGENGTNKAVGELDLLFDYLKDACTETRKTINTRKRGKKRN